jgi:hypothetical protein
LVGALLMGPISWPGYMTMLLPTLLDVPWTTRIAVAAAILAVPVWVTTAAATQSPVHNAVFGAANGLALLLILSDLLPAHRPTAGEAVAVA